MPNCFPEEADGSHRHRSRGIRLARPLTPYGSEFSTDGNRLVRALEGMSRLPLYPASCLQAAGGRFPFSTART